MKRLISLIVLFALLVCSSALAYAGAIPNQKLSFRTGPNTKYAEMFTLPQSTNIIAHEFEEGNGVTWVLCEFIYKGKTYFGYTGLKRMTLLDDIDYAYHDYTPGCMTRSSAVYSAPFTYNSVERGRVSANEVVNLLRFDGSMAYVEFYDSGSKAISRGWVPADYVELYYGYDAAIITDGGKVYSGPGSNYRSVGRVGDKELVMSGETSGNYREILFYSSNSRDLEYGYVKTSSVEWLF